MELEALFDAVIVKPIEAEETTFGNIIVPDLGKEKNEMGTVMAVGPGKPTITGEFISTNIKVGDIVVLPTMGFTKLPYNGDEYYVSVTSQDIEFDKLILTSFNFVPYHFINTKTDQEQI